MGLTCCPNPTKRKLMSAHKVGGNQDSSVRRVNSGVASVGTHPSREHTLLTFVSTINPSSPLHHNVDLPLNMLLTPNHLTVLCLICLVHVFTDCVTKVNL